VRYLLDTNVISELVAPRPNEDVRRWVGALEPDSVYLSVVTIGEIRKGIEKLAATERKVKLERWLSQDLLVRFAGRILPFDVESALVWGELTGRLEKIGKPLPAVDSLVAALALANDCTLVTRNTDHFKATGATLANPWTDAGTPPA
jgi:tRNA(fMet)-specific endonuclease VapC